MKYPNTANWAAKRAKHVAILMMVCTQNLKRDTVDPNIPLAYLRLQMVQFMAKAHVNRMPQSLKHLTRENQLPQVRDL